MTHTFDRPLEYGPIALRKQSRAAYAAGEESAGRHYENLAIIEEDRSPEDASEELIDEYIESGLVGWSVFMAQRKTG